MRKKVLYVIDTLQTGGAERSILEIGSRLRNYEAVVCHLYRGESLKPEFEKAGVRVISINLAGAFQFLRGAREFIKVIKKERPAVVVATLLRSELISRISCFITRVPNLGTFVNDTYSKYELRSQSFQMLLKTGFFWVWNVATAVICKGFISNAESIKESNCKALFVPRNKVTVIYRGRDVDKFAFNKKEYNPDCWHFLAVGRLIFRKGHQESIRAFREFVSHHENSHLYIAGEGKYRKQLEKLIFDLGLASRVTLLGDTGNISEWMRKCDMLLFSSHYEGFSGTLVEAMLSGLPIIASNIAMNSEAVVHGETGRLFPVADWRGLYQEMKWVSDHWENGLQMSRNACYYARQRFDILKIAEQHELYYDKFLTAK